MVYLLYLTKYWRRYFKNQMNVLKKCGLYDLADVYVSTSSDNPNRLPNFRRFMAKYPDIRLQNIYGQNLFEYPGLKTTHELGQRGESLILYHHSRGISRNQRGWEPLARQTIQNFREIVKIFEENDVDLVGAAPAIGGWVWFNFFWVTSSYLKQCKPPAHPQNINVRGYYESYIGRSSKRKSITYSPIIKWDRVNDVGAWQVFARC